MKRKKYQKAADTVIGTIMETLESYYLSEAAKNTIKRVAWAELDRQFEKYIDEVGTD